MFYTLDNRFGAGMMELSRGYGWIIVYTLTVFTTKVFFGKGTALRGLVSHN